MIGVVGRCHRRLILGPHVATLDAQPAVTVNADEDAGADDVGGVECRRAVLKYLDRRLNLGQSCLDRLRQFFGLAILLLQRVVFALQRIERRLLRLGQRIGARQRTQPLPVAVREVRRGLDPFPAFGADGVGLPRELLGD